MKSILLILLLLLFYLKYILCDESSYEIFPLRFDLILNRIRYNKNLMMNELIDFSNSIKPIEMSKYLSSRTSKEITLCDEHIEMIINGTLEYENWALKIIDSWGKPLPSGILKGNVFWMGDYDQCIEPMYLPLNKTYLSQPFNTQHCTIFPIRSSTRDLLDIFSSITIGICVPSSCNRRMITLLIQSMFNSTNITENNLVCSNDPRNGQEGFSGGVIATCVILSFLAFIVFIGTIIDLIINSKLKLKEKFIEHKNKIVDNNDYSSKMFNLIIFLSNFSGLNSLRRIFTMKKVNDENCFDFINGIRVLSLFWVIIGHSVLDSIGYTSNIIDVLSWSENIFFQLIINAPFTVDTFFVLSGFLTTILFIKQINKEKLSLRLIIMYYIHRYIRLTPTFLLLLLVSINLTPYFGRGPIYPIKNGFESESCRNSYWWTSILYIGNIVRPDKMCFGIAWYLFNDMQFHWIAPLAILPFALGKKLIAFIITISFIFIGIFSIIGILLYYPDMSVNSFDEFQFSSGINFFNNIYVVPWCRISAYAVGILTGFILLITGRKYNINISILLFGSIISIVISLTCIFSVYNEYRNEPGLNRRSLISYQSLSRTGWSLSIGWLIFLCSINHGGIINKILSWTIWLPFSRLNYSAFLVHPTILYIIIFNRTIPFYFQAHILLNNFVSHIFFSYLAAILVYIFFETPFVVIEKQLFKQIRKNKISNLIN